MTLQVAEVVVPRIGKDASDHLTSGATPSEFVSLDDYLSGHPSDPSATTNDEEAAEAPVDDADQTLDHRADWLEPGPVWYARADTAQQKPLIEGILASSGIAMIGGEPKVGKTWLITDLVVSVATGTPFLNRYEVATSGRVLVMATEGGLPEMRVRYAGIAKGKGLDPMEVMRSVDFVWHRPAALDSKGDLAWLHRLASTYVLIIVDVLRDAWTGEENSNDAVAALLRGLRQVANEGPTVALVQHFSKSNQDTASRREGQRLRGGSAFHAALDSGVYLKRSAGSARTTVVLESKDDVHQEPFTFCWPDERVDGSTAVTLDWRAGEESVADGPNVVTEVLRTITENPGESKTRTSDLARVRKSSALRAIDGLVAQGVVEVRSVSRPSRSGRMSTVQGLYVAALPAPKTLPDSASAVRDDI